MTRTLQALILLGVIRLVVTAADFLFGADPLALGGAVSLGGVPRVWGLACAVCAVALVAGVVSRRPWLLVPGCGAAFGMYVMFGLTVLGALGVPPVGDWRMLADNFVTAGIWAVVAVSLAFRLGVARILLSRRRVDREYP